MKILKFGLLLGLSALTVSQASANLVANGSFESGAFVDNMGQDTMDLLPLSTAMTGWTTTVAELAWIGPSNPFGLTAANGSYFLDLSGYHDNQPYGGVASTSFGTSVGQAYNVSFALGSSTVYDQNGLPSIQVTVDNGAPQIFTVTSILGANNWQIFSFNFIAAGNSTSLSFLGDGPSNLKYIGLDNVNVTPVPEPATIVAGAMLLLPFGIGALRILRKSRTA